MTPLRKRIWGEAIDDQLPSFISISVILIKDTLIFCLWLGLAWCSHHVAEYFKETNEVFAEAFRWGSSGGTFVLAMVFIFMDILKVLKDFRQVVKEEQE